jgi:phage/plasmid-associated DNA primase
MENKFVRFTIPRIETKLKKDEEKKELIGMPKEWTTKITPENYKKYINKDHEATCMPTGKINNIIVIDFDDRDAYDKMCKEYPDLKNYKTVKTRRGFHVYCNYNSEVLSTTNGLVNYNKVDICSDGKMVLSPPTFYYDFSGNIIEYEDMGGEIMDIPDIIFNDLKQHKTIIVEATANIPVAKAHIITPETEQLLNDAKVNAEENYKTIKSILDAGLLNNKAFGDYDSWRDVGFGIIHATNKSQKGLELWLQFSQINSEKYIFETTMLLWNKTKERRSSATEAKGFKNKPITIGSIMYWAKECNEKVYNSIFHKSSIEYYIDANDLKDIYKVANIISKTLKNSLILCKEKWYMLTDNNLWRQQKEATYYIINEIRKYIDYSNSIIVKKISETTDDVQKEILISQSKIYLLSYNTISTTGFINVINKYLKTLLADDTFYEKIDATPHMLAFKNGIVDLRTKEFRKGIFSSDFITETIPYDYTPCNSEKKEFLLGVLKKILNNNEEHLIYFLSLIGFTFIGVPDLEKSIYFMIDKTLKSKGDNGKTIWFDTLTYLMPNYVYKSKSSFIEKNNSKVHKQLVMTKSKRLVWLEEYPKDKAVNCELTKEIADGKHTENEIMFGTSESINILFKMFVLSNNIPKIEAEEEAVYNRYKQVSYNSHFDRTGTRLIEDPENLLFIADTTLADKLKKEYYNEVFDIIIEYANNYYERKLPKIPEQFIKDANDTKNTNDIFGSWFDDNIEINPNDKVALKKIASECNMTDKQVKEGMLRKGFVYKKDLCGLGKNQFDKYYKGGFEGVSLIVCEGDIDNDIN